MISCYNRGCGQDYDPANNPDGKKYFLNCINYKNINERLLEIYCLNA